MRYLKTILLLIIFFYSTKSVGQPDPFNLKALKGADQKAVYERTKELAEATAKKFDAVGCPASAAYCKKIVSWANCMLNHLGENNNCGLEPPFGDAPKCDAANMDGAGGGSSSGSSADPYKQMQLKQQQTQQELTNAQNASMSAYENAINNGKKASGAMLDATLAGAQQISNPTTSLVYTGIGLGISLFEHISEKKAEKKEKEEAIQREQERKQLIIATKTAFLKEALDINKYNFSDLISKDRFATILLVPNEYDSEEQNIYFSSPLQVIKYLDDTYPLKPDIEKKLLAVLDKNTISNKKVYTLYPITNLEEFTNDFVRKMGSGKVIYLNAQLLNFLKSPFIKNNQQDSETDFWDNSTKKDEKKKPDTDKKPEKSFWDN